MTPIVPELARAALLRTPEKAAHMAKADLRKPENHAGQAIERAQQLCGWSLKEFAGAANRGERQLARWIDGSEHPQLDTLFAIVVFRRPLIIALAEQAGLGVDVQTVITLKTAA